MAKKKSKLEPYAEERKGIIESGATHGKIADAMSLHFDDWCVSTGAIALFVKKHGFKTRVTKGARNGRIAIPICDKCDDCKHYESATRTGTQMACEQLKRMISSSVATSPMDCPKRGIL